ncbi:VirB8/TrbF family protein [Acidithiobacillus caldus]
MSTLRKSREKPATQDIAPANQAWFELYTKPAVERNRAFVLFLLALLAFISLSWAILLLIPRHTDVPWIVPVNPKTGLPVLRPIRITTAYTPSRLEIQYFSARWLRDLFTINPALSMKYITTDYTESAGEGRKQLKTWESVHQPITQMEKYPGLTASARILSTSFMGSGNLFIRVQQTKHYPQRTSVRIWNCTINYALIPPTTVEQAYQNPIGFTVHQFVCTRSLAST